jgi:hypothetical protein
MIEYVQLNLPHLSLLDFELRLDHLQVWILNLVLREVEIVAICTIKPYGVPAFAVAERIVGDALTTENLGQRFRFL